MKSKLKRLIRAIKKVDPKAAEYINKTVLPRYVVNEPPNNLEELFLWGDSPQGNEYWMNIYKSVYQIPYRDLRSKK